jgi:hypothetical protein
MGHSVNKRGQKQLQGRMGMAEFSVSKQRRWKKHGFVSIVRKRLTTFFFSKEKIGKGILTENEWFPSDC